ncbi:hypothetical protein GWN63_02995, partial [Candidatus Bathyarchaeota archaeon]|nr:type II toxin-antitoxin system VapC family toxin [Candidatus Bathyarchaeota archaeon]NIR14544.1 type II toxin-antitoxin system VapC family toxin [Desulfobacterales bacterium]NIU81197.1 hypothetical protein [Candidatus Bathyarchaeota archaeon]NIV68324.1 hypothetical protein [Candidatus Bathyarchaeota archaeon]
MSYLLDSSSILALARKLGGRVVDLAKESFTLSLAYYEIGNALWKECSLLERLSVDEATKILGFIFSLLNVMRTIHVKDSELGL